MGKYHPSGQDKLLSGVWFKYRGETYRYIPEYCLIAHKNIREPLGGYIAKRTKSEGEIYYATLDYHSRIGVNMSSLFFGKTITEKVSYNKLEFLDDEM